MNFLKRAIISIYRRPLKSAIFLVVVLILGVLMSGAILVSNAISNMDKNLRRLMPAIAMVEFDFDHDTALSIYEETGVWPDFEFLTPEIIQRIGSFPQVRIFDYTIDLHFGVTGQNLLWEIPEGYPSRGYDHDLGVEFLVEGVSTTRFLEAREGFLDLIEGRNFTEDEMNNVQDVFPVVISSALANANDFNVGSLFDVQVIVFDRVAIDGGGLAENRDNLPLVNVNFPLEVVGIVEPIFATIAEDTSINEIMQAQSRRLQAMQRIYVPNIVAQLMFEARQMASHNANFEVTLQNFFMLNDPLDFDDFAEEVGNLPGNWRAVDFSRGFNAISPSMENLNDISELIFLLATGATVVIITLLVWLFLYDRKHEIGVYLALGEKKSRITLQIILELIPLAIIGLISALFIGNILADVVSREMLRVGLDDSIAVSMLEESHQLEELGYHFELTHEEMLDMFEVNFNFLTVIVFYAVGIGTVFMATLIPIFKIVNSNPKKVLM